MRRLLPLAVALLGLLVPAAASAGTLTYQPEVHTTLPPDCLGKCGGPVRIDQSEGLEYVAALGEANDVTVTGGGAGGYLVHDAAGLRLGTSIYGGTPHCQLVDATTASCSLNVTRILTGDGEDRVVALRGTLVEGGAGDDALTGSSISGGAGRNTLVGTDGADRIVDDGLRSAIDAGAGDDSVALRGRDDAVDGGPGVDTVDYSYEHGGVTARLDGAPGGTDVLTSIEAITGSRFADTITGSAGDDAIAGGGGTDHIDAGAGDDHVTAQDGGVIQAGAGRDRVMLTRGSACACDPHVTGYVGVVDLAAGDDEVTGASSRTLLRCGDGDDAVATLRKDPALLSDDCERGVRATGPLVRGHGGLRVPFACAGPAAGASTCAVHAELTVHGTHLASVRQAFSAAKGDGAQAAVRLVLPAGTRRALAQGRRITARLRIVRRFTVPGGAVTLAHVTRTVTLTRADLGPKAA